MYLDDLFVVPKDLNSHLKKLSLTLQKLTQVGPIVKLTKKEFIKSRIEVLGHLVGENGIHTANPKIIAVKNFPNPKSVGSVRSFLGVAGYYRTFIKNFASIASPLTLLLKKDVPFL